MSFSFSGKFKTRQAARAFVGDSYAPGTVRAYVLDAIAPLREPGEGEAIAISAYGHLGNHADDATTATVSVKLEKD